MKRIAALAAALCLLAGCTGSGTTAAAVPPAPQPSQPAALDVYCGTPAQGALYAAVERYAQAEGVTVHVTADPAAADLALLPALPDGADGWQDLTGQTLLAAAAGRAGLPAGDQDAVTALPLGRSLYGYWADTGLLTALLGEDGAADLQQASWGEWQNFVLSVAAWIETPTGIPLTLNGHDYTLPAEKPEQAAALEGVFAVPGGDAGAAWSGAAFTSALLAAGGERTADTLTGPAGSVYSALTLELENTAGDPGQTLADAAAMLADGRALFCRAGLADLAALLGADAVQSFTPLPYKCYFVQDDLSTEEYTLTGLMNYPTLACAGYLAIPAAADNAEGAASAILWMYGSGSGNSELTDGLLLVTPWNTASDATDLGTRQVEIVSTGILPEEALTLGQAQALADAGSALAGAETFSYLTRDAFIQTAVQALSG